MQSPCKASSIVALLLILIYLHFLAVQVSSQDTLQQGEILTSSSPLISANGVYTLGFYTPQATDNTYLAVWFTDRSYPPVWIGNREQPVPSNTTPFLTIGTRGELIIAREGGEPIELYAGGSGQNITASLLNSGNFVVNSSESSSFLWQSFDHPTDTLLPGMKLGLNRRTGGNWALSSWLGPSNPAPGPFTLEWDPNAGVLVFRRRGVVYWRSGELRDYLDQDLSSSSVKEFENFIRPDAFNHNYNLTNVTTNEEAYFMYSLIQVPNQTPEERRIISGWTVDDQGNIDDTSRGTLAMPSLCSGYNTSGGCALREQPSCRNQRQAFVLRSGSFRPVNGRPPPSTSDSNASLTLSDCREVCWNDCDCVAYTNGTTGCVYWRGEDLEFEQSLDGVRTYVLESSSSGKKKTHIQIILPVVGSVVLLILAIAFFVVRKLKKGKRQEELRELLTLEGYTDNYDLENGGANNDLKLFTYASIMSATSNFSSDNKLGEGGFGPVYKGKTSEGQDIAVKLLSRLSGQGLLEFKTELILISKLQHVNLVKVIGFCIHGDDKMIIYEYMHNKSLDFFLFNPSKREQLDWEKRFSIIEGTAQGLLYLHKYSRLRIIHRDLKPNNVLLDQNMNPKISDFGLARIFKQNASEEANTNRRVGTYGYMAPEYAMQGIFSVKSDIYSFGVLVLEIVSGRKNNSFHQIEGPLNLVEHAWELWRKDSALQLMDPTLRDSCTADQLQRCIHIGLLCVENHAADRPTIEDVISMLKNETTALPMPKTPAFITRNSVVEEAGKSTQERERLSTNEVTLSEIEGR